ncbi:ABC transporter G family member 1-like [Oryza glaberrima]|uniref:ABC transporter domain-containing protein n=1 Tax=Oryza glaberrima TaxID=4538 RepID=I1R5V2_ORYGL|nr:ABC transporter G family member 1-like [Oryza glaberrima]
MAATSPLPRWAPTPSPSRPLWRWGWGGGATPDARADGGVTGWTSSFFAAVFPWTRRRRVDDRWAPSAGGGVGTFDGVEVPLPAAQAVSLPRAAADVVDDPAVFLTWEDVRVTVPGRTRGSPPARILDGITGHARPGEVLAIMGPSGCGKTTLLDTLAGRLGPEMNQTGVILINGRQEKLAFGTSAYVTQDNVLMSTLSVREAVYYSAHLQLPDTMLASEKRAHAERVIREMGLSDNMDTRIGGRITKGISGGQRKRMSICIEMLTRPRLLFLDEPTSGLDSAASYHVMSHITRVAAREGMTVIAAVHQPSGDVFDLFHGLLLLAYGRMVFFGTVSNATEFFTQSGFPCPHLRNPSDHFLRTINKDFDEGTMESSKANRKTAAEATNILTNAYHSSTYSEKTANEIVEMKGMGGTPFRRKEQASFLTKLLVLTRRSFLNMHRDIGYYWMRLGIYLGIGICLGTIFYQVGYSYSSIQSRCEVIMYTTALVTFMAIGGFPSFVEDIKLFRRERLSGHYGVMEFVISNTLSATPYLAVIAVIPGAMMYYLTGLTRGAEHFAYFVATLCMCTLLVESMMMIIAVIVPDFLMGIIIGAGIQGMMMLNGGFFRLPNELPKPVWKYPCYYISFHKYAVQGFYKNEFIGLSFPSDQLIEANATISGLQVLKERLQVEMGYSKWVNLAILFGMMVTYRMIFFVIVKIAEELRLKLRGIRFRRLK